MMLNESAILLFATYFKFKILLYDKDIDFFQTKYYSCEQNILIL